MSFRDAFTRNNRQTAKTEPQPLRTNRQQLDEKLVEEALTKIELTYVRKEYGYYVGQFGTDMSMVVEVSLVGSEEPSRADQLMITCKYKPPIPEDKLVTAVITCNKHNMNSRWGRSIISVNEDRDEGEVSYEHIIEFEEGLVSLNHLLKRVIIFPIADARRLFKEVAEATGIPTAEQFKEQMISTIANNMMKSFGLTNE